MPEPDLNFVLRRLDAIQRELREGLHTMALRDDQREASYQTMIQTLTRQMVQVASAVEAQMAQMTSAGEARMAQMTHAFEERLGMIDDRLNSRLSRLEAMLIDIARKLDA